MITILDNLDQPLWGIYNRSELRWECDYHGVIFASNCKPLIQAQLTCIHPIGGLVNGEFMNNPLELRQINNG